MSPTVDKIACGCIFDLARAILLSGTSFRLNGLKEEALMDIFRTKNIDTLKEGADKQKLKKNTGRD